MDIIRRTTHVEHVGGDIDQRFGSLKIDVTELAFPQESFDAVICNHVLEHVPDDRRAMAELLRVLRPGGWGLLMAPLRDEPTDEDPGVSDPQERIRRFGQHDHVRWYNRDDYVGRLRATGWNIEVRFFGDVAGATSGASACASATTASCSVQNGFQPPSRQSRWNSLRARAAAVALIVSA